MSTLALEAGKLNSMKRFESISQSLLRNQFGPFLKASHKTGKRKSYVVPGGSKPKGVSDSVSGAVLKSMGPSLGLES